jgi:hypothetical protein
MAAAKETRHGERQEREKSGGNTPLREARDIWSLDPRGWTATMDLHVA